MSEEVLQTAEKIREAKGRGEKERYIQVECRRLDILNCGVGEES